MAMLAGEFWALRSTHLEAAKVVNTDLTSFRQIPSSKSAREKILFTLLDCQVGDILNIVLQTWPFSTALGNRKDSDFNLPTPGLEILNLKIMTHKR